MADGYKDEYIEVLKQKIEDQKQMIENLNKTIENLNLTIANLQETLDEFKRKLFGTSSEKTKQDSPNTNEPAVDTPVIESVVKEHKRKTSSKSTRADLYQALPVQDILIPIPDSERFCPDCGAEMKHLGYSYVREELRVIPAKVFRVRYKQEKLYCPICREEDDTTIKAANAPTALLPHSPASPSMVAMVMYQKSFMHMPFYRQEADWRQRGVPLPRETTCNWYNTCANKYLLPIYEKMHEELLQREVIHADEVPCQVLHEEGKAATSRSYMWIYLSGNDGKPSIVLYDYRPGRSGDYPIEFLSGFHGMLHCDGYAAYGRIEDVILVCCLAHCRRKFYEAIPLTMRKKIKLLDINSDQELADPVVEIRSDKLPAQIGLEFCNKLFYLEREYKTLSAEERYTKRQDNELVVWNEFWEWLKTLNPTKGSKLGKAVTYALNHQKTLMNYLLDGRCEISNNAAERRAKSYVTGRKNFLFHGTEDGATASAIVLSLIETAKANDLNVYQYLYMLLLYMPDYMDEPAGIEKLLPWSDFIKTNCSGIVDTENITPENHGNLLN